MSKSSSGIALALVLTVGLALLRLIHLGADTPAELSPSDGPYVDEGYKTLSPRNLVLFGTTHWSTEDAYTGWMELSPITQWSYVAGFRLFGATLEAARAVTVVFFALLLLGFVWAASSRYRPGLLLGGLALLGLESTLFLFSRIAIFEVPIAALLYGLLFVFFRLSPRRSVLPLALALAASVLLVFGVKLSSLLYLAPILLASSLFMFRQQETRRRLLDWRYQALGAAGLVAVLAVSADRWKPIVAEALRRIHLVPLDVVQRIFDNPLVAGSLAIVMAGLICTVHGLICRPDLFLGTVYRSSLVALVLLGIPTIALFEYNPLRYYVPLIPAYILIVLEWAYLESWKFRGKTVAAALFVLVPWFVVQNARVLGSFFFSPTSQAREIRHDLTGLIPEDSIVAGVWAPFITFGTSFKSLYVAAGANHPQALPELAPDYVLQTVGNENSAFMLRTIAETGGISLGPPIYDSSYNEQTVILYPVEYNWRSAASLRRGAFAIGRALARADDPEAAEPWLRRALAEQMQQGPGALLRIAESQAEWGACLVKLGRYAEAEPPLLAAYEVYRPRGGAPASALARLSLKRLIALYAGWNRPERSAEIRALLEGSD